MICLHDYQNDIKSRLFEAWQRCRSVMLQMPTGTGKTHVLAAVVNEECRMKSQRSMQVNEEFAHKPASVCIIAHRRELVAQIEETVSRFGIDRDDCRVRVMSIQWLSRHWDDVDVAPRLVIIDEAHHAVAETYMEMWHRWPKARFLGLTATPCRMNHRGFTDLFDSLICSWSIAEFIERGWLSAFDYVSIRQGSDDQRLIDSLEKRGADGDYQIKEMNTVLNRHSSIERLYRSMDRFAHGKKGIVYAIGIGHARRIAEYYSSRGVNAVPIDSKTPAAERKRFVEAFKSGAIQVLVNVDIFSEGFDCPDVEFVQLARPTLSLAKYLQQVGRGLRKAAGKDSCMIIDNVGLYRVFGLPVADRDWDMMFRGDISGKGMPAEPVSDITVVAQQPMRVLPANDDNEMELIVSHDNLLSAITELRETRQPATPKLSGLKAWQDRNTGLWGLKTGRRHTAKAEFATVFDIRYGMAAVRYRNNLCALVNASGECLWLKGNYRSMKFLRNNFITVQTADGKHCFVDLYSRQKYDERPEVKRFGSVELLKIGHTYYSRTKHCYVNNRNINTDYILNRKFYIAIFDNNLLDTCGIGASNTDGYMQGYACLLSGDYDEYYRIHRWLADGSIVIADSKSNYYHAVDGKEKNYIGCCDTVANAAKCRETIDRMAQAAIESRQLQDKAKAEKRLQRLTNSDEIMPFRSGMKWGLRVGSHIVVPPIYRNVKSPVGKYCAVEKYHGLWGVVALDGTLMVEPRYSDIEISIQGIVTGTKTTGSKVSLKLP